MCISKILNFGNIKANIDNNVLKRDYPLRIRLIFNEDQYGHLVLDKKRVLKTIFQINTWC